MRILGGQYVVAARSTKPCAAAETQNEPGTLFSFDMLGEGARTFADAKRYFHAYSHAIDVIGGRPALLPIPKRTTAYP